MDLENEAIFLNISLYTQEDLTSLHELVRTDEPSVNVMLSYSGRDSH